MLLTGCICGSHDFDRFPGPTSECDCMRLYVCHPCIRAAVIIHSGACMCGMERVLHQQSGPPSGLYGARGLHPCHCLTIWNPGTASANWVIFPTLESRKGFFLTRYLGNGNREGLFSVCFWRLWGQKKKSYKPLRARKKRLLQQRGYKTHAWIEVCCQYSSLA